MYIKYCEKINSKVLEQIKLVITLQGLQPLESYD